MPDFDSELEDVLRGIQQPSGGGITPPRVPFSPPRVEFREMSRLGAIPGAVGEVALDFARDVADIPQRIFKLTEPGRLKQSVDFLESREKQLMKGGLSRFEAEKQASGELLEQAPAAQVKREEVTGLVDIATLGAPIGRIANPIARKLGQKVFERTAGTRIAGSLAERGVSLPQVVEESIRAGAAGTKFGAAVPRREVAAKPVERAKEAAELGVISTLFPGVGAGVRVSGIPDVISNAFARLSTRVRGVTPADATLAKTAREELRSIVRSKPVQEALQQEGTQLGNAARAVVAELDDLGQATLAEAGTIARTGTVGRAAREPLRQLARQTTVKAVTPQRVRTVNGAIVILADQVQELAQNTVNRAGNAATVEEALSLARLMNVAARERARMARTFGLTGKAFQEPTSAQAKAEARAAIETLRSAMRQAGASLEAMPALESGPAKTLFREGVEAIRTGNVGRAARIFGIDFWRRAIFPWFSFLADLPSDVGTLSEKAQGDIISDALDFVRTGSVGQRVRGSLDAVRYWRRFPKEQLETILGENPALGQRFRPFFGERADPFLFTGLELKKIIDGSARAFAFKSVILEQARKEAVGRGLQGVARQNYVRSRVAELLKDKRVVERALQEGQRASFTLPLPRSIEKLTSNPCFILFISPFGRFGVQWIRFLAEFTPASPTFLRKVLRGTATADDAVAFALRNTESASFVNLVNETIYDDVDFQRFEFQFKDLDGKVVRRKGIRGIPFLVEGLFFSALLRGDSENARRALTESSVTFLSSPGLVGRLFGSVQDHLDGRLSARSLRTRTEEFFASYFPQRTILGVFEQLLSPEQRQTGFRSIPFLSETGRVRIDPFTGEELLPQRFVSGTDISAPSSLGGRVLSTELSREEEFLREIGVSDRFTTVRFPQIQTVGADKPSDTPPEVQERFERIWGEMHGRLVRGLLRTIPRDKIGTPEGKKAARELYRKMRSKITAIAKAMIVADGVRLVGTGQGSAPSVPFLPPQPGARTPAGAS
jgi:hypothetical protein